MAVILGIETSCDDTAAAIVKDGKILSNVIAPQINLHSITGGVVPEVAARAHVERIIPVIEQALYAFKSYKTHNRPDERWSSSKLSKRAASERLSDLNDIDVIAVTVGPGLLGSLLVGVETAKALGYALKKPILPINHLEGHIITAFAAQIQNAKFKMQNYLPALALVVSGGHTELILVKKFFSYEIIGQTRDDAAGEAFDKIARMLDLGYPGGPSLAKLAEKGDPKAFDFPRGMAASGDFDFSFSGLKTAVLYKIRELENSKLVKRDSKTNSLIPNLLITNIAASVQEAIVDILIQKTLAAARRFDVKSILLGGGVSANQELRQRFSEVINNYQLLIAPLELTTDNAAMIALAGYMRYMAGERKYWYDVKINPGLEL